MENYRGVTIFLCENRRMIAQGIFIFKLLTGQTDAPLLLNNVNGYVPFRPSRQFLMSELCYRLLCAIDLLLLPSMNFVLDCH